MQCHDPSITDKSEDVVCINIRTSSYHHQHHRHHIMTVIDIDMIAIIISIVSVQRCVDIAMNSLTTIVVAIIIQCIISSSRIVLTSSPSSWTGVNSNSLSHFGNF